MREEVDFCPLSRSERFSSDRHPDAQIGTCAFAGTVSGDDVRNRHNLERYSSVPLPGGGLAPVGRSSDIPGELALPVPNSRA